MGWIRGETIGRGSFATVSTAVDNQTGDIFAVKSAELSRSDSLQKEQEILAGLTSPYVIAYKGNCITSENGKLLYNLCLEYARGGSLSNAMANHGGYFTEVVIQTCVHKILLGIHYLHCNGLVHRDIKPQNILVTGDGVKIADLGCARRVDEASSCDSSLFSGTPVYMAPEVARGEEQGFPADIWAFGCMIIEMATGRAPWVGVLDPVSVLYRIGCSDDTPDIPKCLSDKAKDFLSKCLIRDPKERSTANELLNHAFLNDGLEEINMFHVGTTPTSVLDQILWQTEEELAINQKSYLNSPSKRVEKLSGMSSKIPNWWSSDETWVTVRSMERKETHLSSTIHEIGISDAREIKATVIQVGKQDKSISPARGYCHDCDARLF